MPRKAALGYAYQKWIYRVPFTGILSVTTQANLVLSQAIRASFELVAVELIPTVVATGAGASRVINVRKGSATGTIAGTITALLADGATLGVVKVGTVTLTTAANKFVDEGAVPDTLTIECPTAGSVVFTAGEFDLALTVRTQLQRGAT